MCNGTTVTIYLNGQPGRSITLARAVDLTGTCRHEIDGDANDNCRFAAWNPASVPASLLDEIRACVMNPEKDPPSLSNKRVDFPLNETTLPLATSTTVANQGSGGGTLTLSAQRSVSTKVMFSGP